MLDEVCAYFAEVKTLAKTTKCEVEVRKNGAISFLNDELIKEREAARKGIEIGLITTGVVLRDRLQSGGDAFEIHGGRVTGRV